MTDEPLVNPHSSATLDYCEGEGLDKPDHIVACVDCPAGIWHRSQKAELNCFCTLFHRNTWAKEVLDPILKCDGREAAVAKLVGEKAAAQSSR